MESSQLKKYRNQQKRKLRVRSSIHGSSDKPRLSVFKSNLHLHAQLIDDEKRITLASASTLSEEFGKKNKASAKQIGKKIAELAKAKEIKKVVFDRGPYKFHGVVAALAEGAREGGLEV